jgi:DNA-binding transcriptional MocR family regulator
MVANTDLAPEFLYRQVATLLEQQILKGVLKTGDKLLSVRALSKEQGISISTAFNAYAQLEIKGLIEARPKSGYYVRFTPRMRPKMLTTIPEPANAKEVTLDEMIKAVYHTISGEDVVRLSLAMPGIELLPQAKLSKAMMEVLREGPGSCMPYENRQGNLRLREQVARYSFNSGCVVSADDVITTQGCMEALVYCLRAVTKPGDAVAIESPTYFSIFNVMQNMGLKVVEIPTDPITGVNVDYLAKTIKKVPIKACLFVTNFNNPLGSCMPDDHKKRLVQLLSRHDIPLIEDDIYGEIYFGKKRPRTCKSYDEKGLVLLCTSISKSLTPGYRVGWCMPGRYFEQVLNIKLMYSVSSATPTQAAIGRFFETGRFDLHMRHLRSALHTQCLRYIQAITAYFPEDTRITQPQGGEVIWVELNPCVNAFELFRNAIAENISIAPGQIFSTDARFSHYIRLSFGNPFDKKIDKSLKTLGRLIKEMIATAG